MHNHQIFDAGADDFISKPIVGPELIARIIPRLERIRTAKRMHSNSQNRGSAPQSASYQEFMRKQQTWLSPNTSSNRNKPHHISYEATIAALSLSALQGIELSDLIEQSMDRITACLDIKYCGLFELIQNRTVLRLKYGKGWPTELIGNALMSTKHLLIFDALKTNQTSIGRLQSNSGLKEPIFLKDTRVESCVNVPIYIGKEPYGILTVFGQPNRHFGQTDIDFVEALAQIIAGVMQHYQTQSTLERLQADLELRVKTETAQLIQINQQL